MEFIVDKSKKTVWITKEFNAPRDLVWDAYTKAELLDQWWAPKPMTSRPAALSARALSVTAMVAEGLMRLSDCASSAMRISASPVACAS